MAVVDNPTVRNVMIGQDSKLRRAVTPKARKSDPLSRPHKPVLDEMGIATWHEVKPVRSGDAPRKPNLDEMGPGVESIPARKGEGPRSTMGRPGQHGGFKSNKRGR